MDITLPPCDPDVFRNGNPLLAADTSDCGARQFEAWVKSIAELSGQRVDWHYSGGIAQVLYIGDRRAIVKALAMGALCPARIMRRFSTTDAGLHRHGVTSPKDPS